MNPLKTCFLIPSVASGGIEMYLLRFLNYIEDTNNITVLVRSNEKGELYEEYKATGVNLKFLPLGYLSPKRIKDHYKYYKEQQFDVICDFNANFAGIPMFLAKKLKIQKRVTFYRQGSDHFPPSFVKNNVNTLMNILVYNNSTHILSNSKAALDYFFPMRSKTDERFKVIYNGVKIEDYKFTESKESIRRELGIPQDAFVIGHVGRLDKAKNHDTILKVFQQVFKEKQDAYLLLCGRDTEKLITVIQELNISERTLVLGYRKDIPRVLKSLDCFFFPSITEGQPNALIEAMVSGIPIVASDIPSIKECVSKEIIPDLKQPFDVNGFKNEVFAIVNQKPKSNEFVAKEKFNDRKNFKLFNTLINE
jgi:glycosyltransferase involved in cell wall biosynthesis